MQLDSFMSHQGQPQPGNPSADNGMDTLVTAPANPVQALGDACLVHIYPTGPHMGRRIQLGQGIIVVGRDAECGVPLDDPSVSRKHAELRPGKSGHYLIDLQSTNGTFINDNRVSLHKLESGDSLRIGTFIFRYLLGGSVESLYHEEIYRLTIHDGLTSIANKRHFLESLERELLRSQRHAHPLSLLMLDIDHFKAINDGFGHLCGDYVLRELAALLNRSMRREELLARFGGEEFGAILPETDERGALQLAERLRRLIERHPFRYEQRDFNVTVSIGAATMQGYEHLTSTQLIGQADDRLYQAKHAGRNRVVANAAHQA